MGFLHDKAGALSRQWSCGRGFAAMDGGTRVTQEQLPSSLANRSCRGGDDTLGVVYANHP
ncbi:hypothetical protein [Pseudoalteromonas sp. T1lg10]|uniref:hypothetical protein n=1 Tax=Pseudoalteromonas sp. T1lg10 TaxID=2077093 RepID=UPI001F3BF2DE|nr:hypothetical protein [Pseudoalteromonas sp. T1lg10]